MARLADRRTPEPLLSAMVYVMNAHAEVRRASDSRTKLLVETMTAAAKKGEI